MQPNVDNIWQETRKLSRYEKMYLLKKLIRQLRIDETEKAGHIDWEQMYGIGKGIWKIDAQEYVNELREVPVSLNNEEVAKKFMDFLSS